MHGTLSSMDTTTRERERERLFHSCKEVTHTRFVSCGQSVLLVVAPPVLVFCLPFDRCLPGFLCLQELHCWCVLAAEYLAADQQRASSSCSGSSGIVSVPRPRAIHAAASSLAAASSSHVAVRTLIISCLLFGVLPCGVCTHSVYEHTMRMLTATSPTCGSSSASTRGALV